MAADGRAHVSADCPVVNQVTNCTDFGLVAEPVATSCRFLANLAPLCNGSTRFLWLFLWWMIFLAEVSNLYSWPRAPKFWFCTILPKYHTEECLNSWISEELIRIFSWISRRRSKNSNSTTLWWGDTGIVEWGNIVYTIYIRHPVDCQVQVRGITWSVQNQVAVSSFMLRWIFFGLCTKQMTFGDCKHGLVVREEKVARSNKAITHVLQIWWMKNVKLKLFNVIKI